MSPYKRLLGTITEYSLPLIAGVFAALWAANAAPEWYQQWVHGELVDGLEVLHHPVTPAFLINDIFMVFFFGVAMKEITDAVLPGGALNPVSRAINPLLATLGGVLGPALVFLGLTFALNEPDRAMEVANGWAIPTATDIALAWLAARLVFGPLHPAVSFLLLLAIADDAIGLGIIAVFYPDPHNPVMPANLLFVLGGMAVVYLLRRLKLRPWWPYVLLGGSLSWYGLISAHLHPALALVFIIPLLPSGVREEGLIPEGAGAASGSPGGAHRPSPLQAFEHATKGFVDWGLFFFAFANAGVRFSSTGTTTWVVLASLLVGKTLGVTVFSLAGTKAGFPLPRGMNRRALITAGLVAGLGLTVALFVCGVAYTDAGLRDEAKMGALCSAIVFPLSLLLGRLLGLRTAHRPQAPLDPVSRQG